MDTRHPLTRWVAVVLGVADTVNPLGAGLPWSLGFQIRGRGWGRAPSGHGYGGPTRIFYFI
jgi:hypothetical protein